MPNTITQKIVSGLKEYYQRVSLFRQNARLYLVSVLITGISMGVYRLLFNFYVLSLNYDEALLGRLITTNQLTALVLALPMGFLVDRWGRKNALLTRSILLSIAVAVMALWPSQAIFYAMNVLFGIVQSISSVAMAPFLMENSGEEERTYLFSLSSGLQMGSVFIGNWLGGYLPTWFGNLQNVAPTASIAYGNALLSIAGLTFLSFIPLMLLKPIQPQTEEEAENGRFAPINFALNHPKLLGKLLFPSLLISIGAGFFMPFMNVFFRVVHGQSDQVIGTIFAWGSLAMGAGLILAPPIADRIGKIQLVIISQGLSIPFMGLLGFAPIFGISAGAYYVRLALMNMSNPIYQTFVMEQVDKTARATIASLVSLVWSFGRAFSPTVSGYLQVNYGFGPVFSIAISLYATAVVLYYIFFIRLKQVRGKDVTLLSQ
jgi:MFS family permease